MSEQSEVLVIGGGVIGSACACELAQRGTNVTLIEKDQIGHGCSFGNAGLITPCFATPLPMPGMLLQSLKWMFDPDGPLHIKPRPSLALLRWLMRFMVSTRSSQAHRSVAALTQLAKFSMEAYKKMDAQQPGAFSFAQQGVLMVAQSPQGRKTAIHHMELMAGYGIAGNYLEADQLRQLEPAVVGSKVVGGVHFPDEGHVEPLATVEAFANRAKAHGATILTDTEAFEFKVRNRRVEAVRTTHGWHRAEQIVLATGIWSGPLARLLKLRVPLLAGKGYALILEPFEPRQAIPVEMMEKRIIATPRKDSIRIAGTLELVGHDESITTRRVDALLRGARMYLNVPGEPRITEVWRGLRPCTADGMPIIGRPGRFDNVVIAAGHQMLGTLSAPATGRLVGDIITGSSPTFDTAPFSPDRF